MLQQKRAIEYHSEGLRSGKNIYGRTYHINKEQDDDVQKDFQNNEQRVAKCVLQCKEDHNLWDCSLFWGKSPDEKVKIARDNRI